MVPAQSSDDPLHAGKEKAVWERQGASISASLGSVGGGLDDK